MIVELCHIYFFYSFVKYWDRQILADSVDPDQTPRLRRLI